MKNKNSIIDDIKKVFVLIDKNKNKFMLYIILSAIADSAIGICFSYATKSMVDYFIEDAPNAITNAIISVSLVIVAGGILLPIFVYLVSMMKAKIINNIRIELFNQLQKMPARYFEKHHSGDTIARVNKDINALEIALDTIDRFTYRIISIFMFVPYIIYLDYRFGIIALVLGLIAMAFNLKFRLPMREKSKEIHKANAKLTEQLSENVTGFNVIKTYNLSSMYFNKYKEKMDEVVKSEIKLTWTNGFLYSTNSLIGWFSRGGLALLGCYFVIDGTLTAGNLMGGIWIASGLSWAIIAIGEMLATIQKSFAGSDRIYELLSEKTEPERYMTKGIGKVSGIAIKDGFFAYEKDEYVIKNLNIEVPMGKIAALVGYSGGGKSSIVKLLIGLYELNSGQMTINGKNINEYTLEELRDCVAYVPQNAYVFNGSIKENILYGNNNASDAQIIEAAKKANAHDFIMEQINGYDTLVGERGIRLSGGQRQRVAIARAILKGAPVLLLDEATSSLDSQSELLIQAALEELMKNRTSLVVAHRLSTILHADIIYFISEGKVIEQGTHVQLLAKNGAYSELYYREFTKKR